MLSSLPPSGYFTVIYVLTLLCKIVGVPFLGLVVMNNLLPLIMVKRKNTGNDGTMLSFRQKTPISSYTKFQITLSPTLSLSEILERIEERVEKMLEEDSLLNIDIIHTYKPSTEPPTFSTVSFSSINTNVPVHVFLSEKSHSIFFFIDHCIADGLTMYNEVVGPVLGNPRFKLAKRPIYVPLITEFHQLYVLTRMFSIYTGSLLSGQKALPRLEKEMQYPVFHRMELERIKEVKNELKVPVAAVIMAVLVKHLGKSLKKGRSNIKICLSYAFQNENSFNNYSFIILDIRDNLPIDVMARNIHRQLFNRRHEINTMYHLLQLPTGSGGVTKAVQQTICDAYIAMTMVPDGEKEKGEVNIMESMKNEHYSISTGLNMTAVSIGDKVYVSSKVGLVDIERSTFEKELMVSGY
ncbi:hypothetical protein TL16_g03687 [Triparma laevis f. inornata]|uniref:Alcohol acetyltransferase n=2 Tax=Triparma laevis TaxID=1534972 RepID=A0A9W7FKP0_9STRA|nr:hypothetical protein TL16_g03687 [Triparma laevis f. inornata]GMI13786.1 hypothetical protein TrLO_g918 [Triparma laevis f. longispina]